MGSIGSGWEPSLNRAINDRVIKRLQYIEINFL